MSNGHELEAGLPPTDSGDRDRSVQANSVSRVGHSHRRQKLHFVSFSRCCRARAVALRRYTTRPCPLRCRRRCTDAAAGASPRLTVLMEGVVPFSCVLKYRKPVGAVAEQLYLGSQPKKSQRLRELWCCFSSGSYPIEERVNKCIGKLRCEFLLGFGQA